MELWFYRSWPIIPIFDSKPLLDSILLVPCVGAILYWVYISYIRPPVFSIWNGRKFFWVYQRLLHNGSSDELKVALHELNRSARNIVRHATTRPEDESANWNPGRTEAAAIDLILLLGNRRLCSEMAKHSPNTAAIFFHEISKQEKFHLPYGVFAQNVAGAMLTDKSSAIFHEDSGWDSGWSGYAQLYSDEIFANPLHIAELSRKHSSPLDIRYATRQSWDAENWEAYARVALLYLRKIIDTSPRQISNASTYQILNVCASISESAYLLNGVEGPFDRSDEFQKLSVLSNFLRELMGSLDSGNVKVRAPLKPDPDSFSEDFHEKLAQTIFEVIFDIASVRQPNWTCWTVSYNVVWSRIFPLNRGETSTWVFRRVSRLIYQEIIEMEDFFNFRGAAYLGFCLNVLGLDANRRRGWKKSENALRVAVLQWTRKNYSRMREESPKVAEACLHGSVTFDELTNEIVKTYQNETSKVPSEARFKVDIAIP